MPPKRRRKHETAVEPHTDSKRSKISSDRHPTDESSKALTTLAPEPLTPILRDTLESFITSQKDIRSMPLTAASFVKLMRGSICALKLSEEEYASMSSSLEYVTRGSDPATITMAEEKNSLTVEQISFIIGMAMENDDRFCQSVVSYLSALVRGDISEYSDTKLSKVFFAAFFNQKDMKEYTCFGFFDACNVHSLHSLGVYIPVKEILHRHVPLPCTHLTVSMVASLFADIPETLAILRALDLRDDKDQKIKELVQKELKMRDNMLSFIGLPSDFCFPLRYYNDESIFFGLFGEDTKALENELSFGPVKKHTIRSIGTLCKALIESETTDHFDAAVKLVNRCMSFDMFVKIVCFWTVVNAGDPFVIPLVDRSSLIEQVKRSVSTTQKLRMIMYNHFKKAKPIHSYESLKAFIRKHLIVVKGNEEQSQPHDDRSRSIGLFWEHFSDVALSSSFIVPDEMIADVLRNPPAARAGTTTST